MTEDLRNKVVAITGGARGIGAATARALAEAGAQVAVGDLDLDLAHATAHDVGAAMALPLDVTDTASFGAFLDTVEERLGPLDVLVNNAGIMPLATLLEEDDAASARIFDVNVRGVIIGCRQAARRMSAQGGGHLVNVASTAGAAGLPGAASYCASKAAVVTFSEAIEHELKPHGIAVTVVMPGIVQTELATGVSDVAGLKPVTPQEVAEAIVHAIRKPRLEVYVPRSVGPLIRGARMLPRRAGVWMSHRMGAHTVLLQARDDPARAAYERRVAATLEPPSASSPG